MEGSKDLDIQSQIIESASNETSEYDNERDRIEKSHKRKSENESEFGDNYEQGHYRIMEELQNISPILPRRKNQLVYHESDGLAHCESNQIRDIVADNESSYDLEGNDIHHEDLNFASSLSITCTEFMHNNKDVSCNSKSSVDINGELNGKRDASGSQALEGNSPNQLRFNSENDEEQFQHKEYKYKDEKEDDKERKEEVQDDEAFVDQSLSHDSTSIEASNIIDLVDSNNSDGENLNEVDSNCLDELCIECVNDLISLLSSRVGDTPLHYIDRMHCRHHRHQQE